MGEFCSFALPGKTSPSGTEMLKPGEINYTALLKANPGGSMCIQLCIVDMASQWFFGEDRLIFGKRCVFKYSPGKWHSCHSSGHMN